jgi:DNA-3-methyladenine glycosylase II
MPETIYTQATRHLQQVDEKLGAVIERIGPCRMGHESDAWRALSSSIIGQQVSVYAARAIRGRFAALGQNDYPTPQEVLSLADEELRGAGLSRNKVLSLRDLARHFEEKLIDPASFPALEDEAIIAALIPVRGIGRWTAEMFLIFSLSRPDVLAVDDQGLRNAMQKLYELPERPTPTQMREIGEPWRPWRSVASWYLWRSLDNEPKVG